MTGAPLQLHNSLSRATEPFRPLDPANVRVYSCGPTVYNYAHLGNLRAYVFTDTLARALRWKGYPLTHVLNITDVGHLQSDADAGEDKMEARARETGQDIWAVARHYTDAFRSNLADLNIAEPTRMPLATDHVAEMIAFAKVIEANGFTYRLSREDTPEAPGLYFDVRKLGNNYGKLARSETEAARHWITEGRIELVEQKERVADFALWRTTPAGENRQMEWDSPWGRGAPGWHLECSVMSRMYLGDRFDIHTGGIDHREIHHPNEIAQNQAHRGCPEDPDYTGATFWMHNNFLVDRTGKMSKSSGEFLTLQAVIDRGFHPLAYRLMCLQTHYRSEMEFGWEGLAAAATRLKRLVQSVEALRARAGQAIEDDASDPLGPELDQFDRSVSDDLATPRALVALDQALDRKKVPPAAKLRAVARMDEVLGLNLTALTRADLRVRAVGATINGSEVEARLAERQEARAARDFARSDAIRDELAAQGVEVMDGDPLGWDWKVQTR